MTAPDFGRYKIVEEIGRGAMGIVYRATDPAIGRTVALKAINESYLETIGVQSEEYFERFRREAEVAGRLNHPHIVKIYDLGPRYLVMEFVEGQSLAAILRTGARQPLPWILQLVDEAADALDYAHRQGVVHRDIKPANFMIQQSGALKIMDFGLARIEASTLTAAGEIIGSAAYMAPELITEQPADGRSDLFSLGVVVYELLTGNRPFAGGSISAIIARIINDAPPPPTQVELALPPSYDAILARALAKSPADRYPTAAEFAQALRAKAEEAPGARRDEDEASVPAGADHATSRTQTLVPTQAPPPLPDPAQAPALTETVITSALPETVMTPAPTAQVSAVHPADATVIDVLEELNALVQPPAAGAPASVDATQLDGPPNGPAIPAAPSGGLDLPPPIPADGRTIVPAGTVIMDAAPLPAVPGTSSPASAAPATPPKKSIPWVPIALTGGFFLVVLLAGGFMAVRWLLGFLERGSASVTAPSTPPDADATPPPIEAREEAIEPVVEPSIVPEGGAATTVTTTAPARGTLVVSSVPSGARVTVGRRARGSTPLRVELPPGRITVGVHKEGYRPWMQEVSLPAGESVKLQAQLEAIPPPATATPPPAAPTPPPLKRGDLVALTPDVKPPKRVAGDSPGLPRSGPRPRLPASVLLEFVVTEDGAVRDLRVVESGGEVLDRACTEAVARWRYEPAVKDGLEVTVTQRARFTFQSR